MNFRRKDPAFLVNLGKSFTGLLIVDVSFEFFKLSRDWNLERVIAFVVNELLNRGVLLVLAVLAHVVHQLVKAFGLVVVLLNGRGKRCAVSLELLEVVAEFRWIDSGLPLVVVSLFANKVNNFHDVWLFTGFSSFD